MVKKILRDGSPCAKCDQAEEILRKRGYWEHIDRIVYAREDASESEGMKLAEQFKIDLAPFFIVDDDPGTPRIYTRVFEFIKKELNGLSVNSAEDINSSSSESSESATLPKSRGISKPTNLPSSPFDINSAKLRYKKSDPISILHDAQLHFAEDLTLAFSGAEDVILIDMAVKNQRPFTVFCLDTGRLHEQTHAFLDAVRHYYGISIEVFTPSSELLEPFLNEKGSSSFYADGHKECCGIRKVEPLGRALKGRRAWATGMRRDQSPATRENFHHAEIDWEHRNENGRPLVKFNPLLDWSSDQVWEYIRSNGIPYNPLHDEGYRSIGCEPCTRVSRPGEHERAARWWWEEETLRECGLHIKAREEGA